MELYSNIIGKGKPFIILHGFLGMGDNWKTLGSVFSEAGYQIHLIDQRNHGRSFHSSDFNYEVMAQDVVDYCQKHQLKDIVLLGHSMGGKTAMTVATQFPELVGYLIVADISPRYYPVHHDGILEGLNAINFAACKSRSDADKALSQHIKSKPIRQFLLKNLYWKDKDTLGLRLNLEVLTEQVAEVGEALPIHAKYNGPSLFLRGDKSEYIGIQDFDIIKRQFPSAQIETISNAGHWLHAENPEEFYQAVMKFLD